MKRNPPPAVEELSEEEMWDEVFRHTLHNPHQRVIQILDRNGDLLYQSPSLAGKLLRFDDVPSGTITIATIEDSDGRELRLALTQNEYAKIFVAYPLDELHAILEDVITVRLFLSPLTVLIALLGGLALAHRLLKPMDDLAQAAEKITAQNLNIQIPANDREDEVGRLTESFNKMIQRLHSSFSEIQQFSAEASHELRTPLTIMRGEIEVALRNTRLTPHNRELLTSIHDELVRLSSIVENLMTLVKSESGRLVFQFTDVPLNTLIAEVADDARLLANKKKIKVMVEPLEHVVIPGDPMRLRQLFLNLVDNAVKFTRSHGTIVLGMERQNGHAVVKVRDTGIGIPRKDREKIFDRFYRVPRPDQSDAI
ncbi:MAG: sensor histidine kinase, partial [Bacteroidota bacterium]